MRKAVKDGTRTGRRSALEPVHTSAGARAQALQVLIAADKQRRMPAHARMLVIVRETHLVAEAAEKGMMP